MGAVSLARTALIVSPYFPPSTLAGVHRARHLAKHLPTAGWLPIIVCVDEAFHVQSLDPALAALVPRSVEIVKTSAIPAKISRTFGVGDISLRAWFELRRAVLELIQKRDVRTVLITGSPYYPMLLAPEILRKFKVPVVLDFQDPWVSASGARQPRLSKPGAAHLLAKTLEPRALRGAAYITSVSETQNGEMAARYPWFERARMAAIPIGGDPEDFSMVQAAGTVPTAGILDAEKINLSFVGTFMPRSGPSFRALLEAFALVRDEHPKLAQRIRMNFVGTSNQPDNKSTFAVLPIAREAGVLDAVNELPQRLPYMDALYVLASSHGLLLIGSDERHYTASKIYPALMSGRPYLSLFHCDSSAHQILLDAGGGITLAFSDKQGLEKLKPSLVNAIVKIATTPEALGRSDPAAYVMFEARSIAAKFADIFNEVSQARGNNIIGTSFT